MKKQLLFLAFTIICVPIVLDLYQFRSKGISFKKPMSGFTLGSQSENPDVLLDNEGRLKEVGYSTGTFPTKSLNKAVIPKSYFGSDSYLNYLKFLLVEGFHDKRYKSVLRIFAEDFSEKALNYGFEIQFIDMGKVGDIRFINLIESATWSTPVDLTKHSFPNSDLFARWKLDWRLETDQISMEIKDTDKGDHIIRKVTMILKKRKFYCLEKEFVNLESYFVKKKSSDQVTSQDILDENDSRYWQRTIIDGNLEVERKMRTCTIREITWNQSENGRMVQIPERLDEWEVNGDNSGMVGINMVMEGVYPWKYQYSIATALMMDEVTNERNIIITFDNNTNLGEKTKKMGGFDHLFVENKYTPLPPIELRENPKRRQLQYMETFNYDKDTKLNVKLLPLQYQFPLIDWRNAPDFGYVADYIKPHFNVPNWIKHDWGPVYRFFYSVMWKGDSRNNGGFIKENGKPMSTIKHREWVIWWEAIDQHM